VTIGKAYSGLTDAEIAEMTDWFREHTLRQVGRFHVVEPRSSSRSRSTSSTARTATTPASRCVSRASTGCGRTRSRREIDTLSTVEKLHAAYEPGAKFQRHHDEARRGRLTRRDDRTGQDGWPASIDEPARVAALRELLPATGAGIYLDTATRGPVRPKRRGDARGGRVGPARGRVAPGREDDLEQRDAEARAVLAALIGATDPTWR
jgi:hypothetical protein